MSDFLDRLRESVREVDQDWSYYDVEQSVMLLVESGEMGVLGKIDSKGVIKGHTKANCNENLDGLLDAIAPDVVLTDDELSFFFDALYADLTQPNAITAAIKKNTISISIMEHGQATQHLMIRSSGKSVKRVMEAGDCGSSKLASAINDFYNASKLSGDAKRRELANDFKSFEKSVKASRERRLEEYPTLSGDFWEDVHTLYEYSDNFEEFNNLISGTSPHSMRDRHLSRLSRATLAFDMDEDDTSGGTMYRAVPKEVDEIGAGDWVTFDRSYAESHMREMEEYGESYHIISAEATDGEVVMITDANEFTYIPDGLWGEGANSLGDVWDELNAEDKPFRYEPIENMYEQKVKSSGIKLKM